jgi:hypothetical protein
MRKECQSVLQEYGDFMRVSFPGLRLKAPLFYSWEFALRFDLQMGNAQSDETYFEEANRRAGSLWRAFAAPETAPLILVAQELQLKKRNRMRDIDFIRGCVNGLAKENLRFKREQNLYGDGAVWLAAAAKTTANNVDIDPLLAAIANRDYPWRKPRCRADLYFINLSNRMVFNMYDDRGLDVVAAEREALRPIYLSRNDWILDYDRERIEAMMDDMAGNILHRVRSAADEKVLCESDGGLIK